MKKLIKKSNDWLTAQMGWLIPVLYVWTILLSPLTGKPLDWMDVIFLIGLPIILLAHK